MQQLSINMQISSMFLTTVVSLLLLQQIADGYYLPTNRLKRNYAIQSQAIDSEFYRINVAEEHPNVICTARRRCLTYNKYEENCEIALHSVEAFVTAKTFVDNFYADSNSPKYVILDSGCGLGKSSVILAKENPDIAVIAIDKSIHRLSKNKLFDGRIEEPIQSKRKVLRQLLEGDDKSEMVAPTQRKRILPPKPTNLLLLRAELEDFWVLAHRDSDWIVHSHYLLYPNPYPKTKHLFRRWHGSPTFPLLLAFGGELVLRSNWDIYCLEFKRAVESVIDETVAQELLPISNDLEVKELDKDINPLSHFEAKYAAVGVPLYELRISLGRRNTSERKNYLDLLVKSVGALQSKEKSS